MARDPYHAQSKQTYSNSQNAKRAGTKNPKATGEVEQLESGRWVYLVETLENRAEMIATGWAEHRALGEADRQHLLQVHNWTISNGRVYLTCPATDDPNERRFVITGPSGTHTLLVIATDAERLNAHWQGFRKDARNQEPQAATEPKVTTIADLAQFTRIDSDDYRARTEQILTDYRFERATEMESDCHDRWALVRFADGSELTIRDGEMRPRNDNAPDHRQPGYLAKLEQIGATLAPRP